MLEPSLKPPTSRLVANVSRPATRPKLDSRSTLIKLDGEFPAKPIGEHDPEDLPNELVGAYLLG